jgi:endonuclease G
LSLKQIKHKNYMKKIYLLLATAVVLTFANCSKDKRASVATSNTPTFASHTAAARSVYTGFPETFETGSKAAYAAADITLSTGTWNLNDALIGSTTSDRKNGSKSVRVENSGIVSQQFDMANGAYQVSIATGVYGTDASSTWGLWYSTNSGSTWTQAGSTITTSSTTLSTTTFSMDITTAVRFQVRKLSGGRLNIDDITITDDVTSGGGGTATRDDNMGMGNPSGATTDPANTTNYLMVKTQYALSYNNSKGMANWVSWHLSTAWKGSATRCDCFTQDASLPSGYFKATTSNYTNTGFDRGHMCPSEDRDGSSTDNAATFLMTNMTPQAPILNENVWESLEAYCRTLMSAGNELYIISGGNGTGGSGSLGGTTNSIASGSINVPSHFWKVIVVLPIGTNDAARVSTSTRVIAVDMPNQQSVSAHTWGYYRTSVNAVESATGYDFLSNVSTSVQSVVEASVDNGPTN